MAASRPTSPPPAAVVDIASGGKTNLSVYRIHPETNLQLSASTLLTNSSNGSLLLDYACYSVTDDPDVILAHKFYLYVSLVFVVVGLIGNTLSVLVFTSKTMRTISSNFYLFMLAISDSSYLVTVFLAKLLITLRCLHFTDTKADILNHSNALCKVLHYFSDLFSDYSSVLILCFTIERVIAVYLPLKFKEICTLQRAKISCVSVLVIIVVLIAPYHFLMIGLHEEFPVCIVSLDWEVEFTVAYMVEALIFRIVPVFVIAVLNVFIIVRVTEVTQLRKRRKAQENHHLHHHHTPQAIEMQNGGAGSRPGTPQGGSSAASNAAAVSRRRNRRDDKNMQLTVMLILVSTSYILVYLPVLVHFVLWKLMRSDVITLPDAGMDIAQKYTSTLYIAGFAINFFLYTIGGKIFRDQLRDILCRAVGYKQYGTTSEMTTLV